MLALLGFIIGTLVLTGLVVTVCAISSGLDKMEGALWMEYSTGITYEIMEVSKCACGLPMYILDAPNHHTKPKKICEKDLIKYFMNVS